MSGRFETFGRSLFDDGWQGLEVLAPFRTEVFEETPKTIITRNESPDISFDRLDQPLSRLRAWLFLLLCAARPCLYGPVARP